MNTEVVDRIAALCAANGMEKDAIFGKLFNAGRRLLGGAAAPTKLQRFVGQASQPRLAQVNAATVRHPFPGGGAAPPPRPRFGSSADAASAATSAATSPAATGRPLIGAGGVLGLGAAGAGLYGASRTDSAMGTPAEQSWNPLSRLTGPSEDAALSYNSSAYDRLYAEAQKKIDAAYTRPGGGRAEAEALQKQLDDGSYDGNSWLGRLNPFAGGTLKQYGDRLQKAYTNDAAEVKAIGDRMRKRNLNRTDWDRAMAANPEQSARLGADRDAAAAYNTRLEQLRKRMAAAKSTGSWRPTAVSSGASPAYNTPAAAWQLNPGGSVPGRGWFMSPTDRAADPASRLDWSLPPQAAVR